MMINPTQQLELKKPRPLPSSSRHQDSSSRDVPRRKQFKPSRLGTARGELHSIPSTNDVGSTPSSTSQSPQPLISGPIRKSAGMRKNSSNRSRTTTTTVPKQEPIPIEERFRNQLMQPAVFCGLATAVTQGQETLPTTSGHDYKLYLLARRDECEQRSLFTGGLQHDLAGSTTDQSRSTIADSRAVRPKSACIEVPGSGLESELTPPLRCNSLPPYLCSEPTAEQTSNAGTHNCSAHSTGPSSPTAPVLIAEKRSEGNGMDGAPVPLDLSLRGASRSAVSDGGGGRKRKDSSRSSSRSSKRDEQPPVKAMRLEGNVPSLPLLPLLTRPTNDANSKNATTSRVNLMPQLTFMAGGDRTSVWTPQLAAAAASLFANGGRHVDGGRPIGADRLEDNTNEPASPQLMGNVSDDDWESMMEISNTDEAEKIRAIVGDNAAPVTDPNQCLVCRRILSCKSALQMHYRTHTGERPFKCRICQRAFTTKGNLKTHMGVHRNKVQHSTASARVNPLLGAVRRANNPPTPNVVQECPICQKRFSAPPLLHQHIQQHTKNLTENGVHWDRPADRPLEPSTSLATKTLLAPQSLNAYLPFGLPFPPFNPALPPLFHFPHLFPPPMIMPAAPDMQLRQRRTPSPFASHHRRPQSVHTQSSLKNGQFSVANLAASSRPTSERPKEEGEAALNLSVPKRRRGESPTAHNPSTSPKNDTSATIGPFDNPIFFSPSPQKHGPQLSAATAAPDVKLPALPSFFMLQPSRTDPGAVQTGGDVVVAPLPQSNNPSMSNVELGSGRGSSNGNPDLSWSQAEKITGGSSPVANPLDVMEKMCAEAVPEPSPRQPLPLSKHQCPICRKHFSSSSALQIHTRTHTGDKPFVCEVCKRAFTTRGNLKVHMGTHDIHQQPSRRGRRIFDASENGYPSPPREHPDVRGGGGNVAVTMPGASTSNGLLLPPIPDALMFGGGGGGGLALFNPLVQLCQNPLLATNLLLNAVKSSDSAEDASRMGALAAFLRLLPLNGHLKASGTDQTNYSTSAEENHNEELVDDEELH